MTPRVAVTGIGVVSALGRTRDEFRNALMAGLLDGKRRKTRRNQPMCFDDGLSEPVRRMQDDEIVIFA